MLSGMATRPTPLAALFAAAVLIFGGYFVWDKATGFVSAFGEVPDYPGPGTTTVTIDVPSGSSLDVIGGILIDADVVDHEFVDRHCHPRFQTDYR